MPYKVQLETQDYKPLAGSVEYFDINSAQVGMQSIAADGTVLDNELLSNAATVQFTAPGYYVWETSTFLLSNADTTLITMLKKPSLINLAVGFLVGFAIGRMLKI